MSDLYVIKNLKPMKLCSGPKENQYIAVDHDSGGYPHMVEIHEAHVFHNVDAAKRYVDIFKGGSTFNSENWEVHKLNISSTPI